MAKANKLIFTSGIQPTGELMIGNYLGAIRHWVDLQSEYDCIPFVADLHALSVMQDPEVFKSRTLDCFALLIACGIDYQSHTLYVQSHLRSTPELAWLLNCYTYMGELNRMTQFKDKSKKYADNINAGLFNYPVLQAADILIVQANIVPVGRDQKQHLELTRDIATRFNNRYGNIFTLPKPYIAKEGGKIMGLLDPTKKMSKTDANDNNTVRLLDSPDTILNKFKRAVTDSGREILFREDKPGVSNLLTIQSLITQQSMEELEAHYQGKGYADLKREVAECLIEFLKPIQTRFAELRSDEATLKDIMKRGADAATERAESTLQRAKDALGLILR